MKSSPNSPLSNIDKTIFGTHVIFFFSLIGTVKLNFSMYNTKFIRSQKIRFYRSFSTV